jgi:hypothetical protein
MFMTRPVPPGFVDEKGSEPLTGHDPTPARGTRAAPASTA